MSNGNPPRRSRKSEEPQTIDLEAERIVTPSDDAAKPEAAVEAAAASEAPTESAAASEPSPDPVVEPAPQAAPSSETPSSTEKRGSGGGGAGLIAAGIVGGLVVLVGAGAAQYAGFVPNLGPAQKIQLPDYAGQIAGLQQKLADVEKKAANPPVTNLAPVEDRLKNIETAMSKLPVGDLTDVLAIKGKLDETAGKMDKVDAQMASVANRLQQTEAKVNAPRDDVDVARAIASAGLKAAIDRGGPFQAELQTLASVAPNDEAVAALQAFAAKGVPSRSDLIKRYPDAADQMLAVLNKPVAGQSLSDRLFKSAFSVIKVRPVGNVEGTSPDAIIARIGDKLQGSDLAGALREWDTLPDNLKAADQDYHAALEARVKVEALVAQALEHAVKTTGKRG
ncbi:hypothetical protein ABID16_002758 [Rhizobium aquaticum]|uniref:Mitochondrial inner membrane protein n=1 Tax=Rhizobium aquaticum TaxID=1549636 RepID=A0ABV2J110_9HYPH